MKSNPKRVAVGVGFALAAVLLWMVASNYARPPAPLGIAFIGFESRKEGKVAAFVITNTLRGEVFIHGFDRSVRAGFTWRPLPYQEGQVWLENKNSTMAPYRLKPRSLQKLVVRLIPSKSPWRLGALTTHRPSLSYKIWEAWNMKSLHFLQDWLPQPETVYSDPVVN